MESAHEVRGVVNSFLAVAGQAEVTLIIEITRGRGGGGGWGHCQTYREVSCYSNLMESAHAVRGVVNSLLAAAGQAEVTLIIEISESGEIPI